MPTANVNDTVLHYRFDGPEDGPVILVSNSLASNLGMWDHQVDTLIGLGFRVLRYDSRGHGRSGVTPGPYRDDPGTPPSAAEFIHDRIPGSKLLVLAGAAHFCNVEQAGAVNAALEEFLGA